MTIVLCAVSYGGSREVPALIDSLLEQSYPDWRLYIADNSLDSVERRELRTAADVDDRVVYSRMASNAGYFGAAAVVLEKIKAEKFDWFIVCNTDLCFGGQDALEQMASLTDRGRAVIAPSIRSSRSGQDQNPYMKLPLSGRQLIRMRVQSSSVVSTQAAEILSAAKKWYRRDRREVIRGPSASCRIYAPHGSFIGFSRRYFDDGGTLNSPTFLFGEELFVAESVRALGMAVSYEPKVKVVHKDHGNIGVIRSKSVLQWHRESAKFWWEYFSGRREYSPV